MGLESLEILKNELSGNNQHPKCKGYTIPDIGWGVEYDCHYESNLCCDDCKYGGGRKDPEAKCNQDE